MRQDAGRPAGALWRAHDVEQVGIVALLGRRNAKGLEALPGVIERVDTRAPAFVGERRIGYHVIENLKALVAGLAFAELGVGQGGALLDLRRGVIVEDHVHARQATGGRVFLLAVKGELAMRCVSDLEQQRP